MSARLGLAVALLVALAASACVAVAPNDGAPRRISTVTVAGSGTISATPDQAEITIGVVTQAATAAPALAANSQAMERLLQSLGNLGIGPRDIQTTNISVAPQRRAPKEGQPPEITGYEVSNQVRVKVRDLARLGQVLDRQVSQGANLVYGIHFGLQEPAPLLDEARKRAMADARRRADLYAAAAGLKVGRVLSVQEAGVTPPGPAPRMAMSAAVPVAPGEQEIQATVTVTFTLDP